MKTPNFSVVLIAKNERKTLPRLLESLRPFMDAGGEIVLLDTGSSDGTADFARSEGVKVEEVGDKFVKTITFEEARDINERFVQGKDPKLVQEGDKLFNFANARNYAAEFSSNDMIAMPDCDEVYTTLNLEVVTAMIDEGVEQFTYPFVYAHDELGRPTVNFTHSKFYDRRKLKWTGIIHEVLQKMDPAQTIKNASVAKEVIYLEHFQNQETDRSGYLRGLAIACFYEPDNDRNCHYFAREMMYEKRYWSAVKEFERHLEMKKAWRTEQVQSKIYIGDCFRYMGMEIVARSTYIEAFDMQPERREALIRLMEMAYQAKQHDKVIAYGEAALTCQGIDYYSTNARHYGAWPHEMLYWAYWQRGNMEKSRYHFEKALHFEPENPKYIGDKVWYPTESE